MCVWAGCKIEVGLCCLSAMRACSPGESGYWLLPPEGEQRRKYSGSPALPPLTVVVPGTIDAHPVPCQFAVYTRRYWLLLLLSMASMQQACVWLTWSPAVNQVRGALRGRGGSAACVVDAQRACGTSFRAHSRPVGTISCHA